MVMYKSQGTCTAMEPSLQLKWSVAERSKKPLSGNYIFLSAGFNMSKKSKKQEETEEYLSKIKLKEIFQVAI